MLLSSTAEAMYWTGRYFERAQALARAIQSYERLSLDLPDGESVEPARLLPLVGREAASGECAPTPRELLWALVLDTENPSSVRGALERARENLRSGRSVLPPAVWTTINSLHLRLGELDPESVAGVLAALEEIALGGSQVEGELASAMTRGAAYSFWRIGSEVERADMLLRTLAALAPLLEGGGRPFADVRATGLLKCIGAYSMFRWSHHTRTDLPTILRFALAERDFPRSLSYALAAIEAELDGLPRPGAPRSALSACAPDPLSLSSESEVFLVEAARLETAVANFNDTLASTYFPADRKGPCPVPEVSVPEPDTGGSDPFRRLGQEHAAFEAVLRVLDELAARAECGLRVARDDLINIVGFFTDFGVLGHHEKEEAILIPALLGEGFDYHDGPLAEMRHDHRQEHYFLRVLTHLACQLSDWSTEDMRHFASIGREFTRFLREHMRLERREVFEPAAARLSLQAKVALGEELARFDEEAGTSVLVARRRVDGLLAKYAVGVPLSA